MCGECLVAVAIQNDAVVDIEFKAIDQPLVSLIL
jgi:hypothetical protein